MSLWVLTTMIIGCIKPGLYPLTPINAQRRSKEFSVNATAKVDYHGTVSDLLLHLDLRHSGATSARVDLSKLWWQADGVSWQRCRFAKDRDRDSLIFNLEPDQTKTFDLKCRDIPRPYEKLAVRFHTAGTGNLGVVTLEFKGIAQPY